MDCNYSVRLGGVRKHYERLIIHFCYWGHGVSPGTSSAVQICGTYRRLGSLGCYCIGCLGRFHPSCNHYVTRPAEHLSRLILNSVIGRAGTDNSIAAEDQMRANANQACKPARSTAAQTDSGPKNYSYPLNHVRGRAHPAQTDTLSLPQTSTSERENRR